MTMLASFIHPHVVTKLCFFCGRQKIILSVKFPLFLSIQLKSVGSKSTFDPTDFHCMEKNKYIFEFRRRKKVIQIITEIHFWVNCPFNQRLTDLSFFLLNKNAVGAIVNEQNNAKTSIRENPFTGSPEKVMFKYCLCSDCRVSMSMTA